MLRAPRMPRLMLALVLAALGLARAARAADETRVPTAFEEGNPIDVFFSVGWRYENRLSKVKREFETPGQTLDQVGFVKDLKYERRRNVLTLRADIGILWDVGLFVEAPLVLGDERTLSFDQDGAPCIFPGDPSGMPPNCVNQYNSTLINDQANQPLNPSAPTILPGPNTPGSGGAWGLDGTGAAPALYSSGTRVFTGPSRSGLESLNLGLNWAVLSQRKDDTKPTWTVGFEARFQVSGTMAFDRAHPNANTDVGLGYHVARFQSFISKRFRFTDPYFGFWWELPIVHSSRAFPDYTEPGSLGAPAGTGQKNTRPMQSAGAVFGFEAVALEKPHAQQRVGIDFRGHLDAHFEGRGWSELWEVLACSQNDPAPYASSLCFTNDPFRLGSLPGTTDIENYATFGADLGVTVQVGPYVHFRAAFGFDHDQSHTLTFTDAGKDRNGDGMVNPNDPNEVNPLHRPQVDDVGRRFRIDDSTLYRVDVMGSLMF